MRSVSGFARARNAIATSVMALAALAGAGGARVGAQVNAGGPGIEVFSADVSLERSVIDATGKETRPLPPVRYHVSRTQHGSKRTTIIHYATGSDDVLRGAAVDPFAGARAEFDEDGSPIRVFDRDGRALVGASESASRATRPGSASAGPNAGVVVLRDSVEERLKKLRQDLGAPKGNVRGLERYLTQFGDDVQEVLVDRRTATPVEINVSRNGVLQSHSTFGYQPLPDGTLLQRTWRNESAVAGRDGERNVTQLTVSNVTARREQ